MIVVPLALPHAARSATTHRVSPPAQLLAASLTARGAAAHASTGTATSRTAWAEAVAHARYQRFRGELRFQAWRRQVAYQSWRRAVAYTAWRRAVATQATHRTTVTRTGGSGTAPPRTIHGQRVGVATWYAWRPGQCATSYRPKGSRIWITDLATGRTISCVVTDYQPYSPTHVVDLNEASFAELAPLSTGVVEVRVTW
jgi:rare lipoprotein A (peptidoglycan hydrolase)